MTTRAVCGVHVESLRGRKYKHHGWKVLSKSIVEAQHIENFIWGRSFRFPQPLMCWKYALHFIGSTCDHHHEVPLPGSRRRSGRCRLCVYSKQQQSYSMPRRHSAAALGDASGCILHQCQINIVVVPPTTNLLLQSASTALVSASQHQ